MKSKQNLDHLFKHINKKSTIILVGFMGSGKTTIGKQLAKKLNYNFIDTDLEIENLLGISIGNIFKIKGEEYFRNLEQKIIRNIQVKNTIISTGGGLPCHSNNIDYLNNIGTTVYLQCSEYKLFERLKNDYKQRPLIKNKSNEELLKYITETLKIREPYYLKAKTIFSTFA